MNLSEIEERLADATPGPWTAGKNYAAVIAPAIPLVCKGECDCNPTCNEMYGGKLIGESIERADAELIMHAPTDLRELIEEVKRLREWKQMIEGLARIDAKALSATTQVLQSARLELARFHECADGQCLDWASGVYHSDKVWHKEDE